MTAKLKWACFAVVALAVAGLPLLRVAADEKPAAASRRPVPESAPARDASRVEAAIERGRAFLVSRQNKDGSWGSPHNTKGLNIYAPVPGAHDAFRAAVTALCVSALIETGLIEMGPAGAGSKDAGAAAALARGEKWLIDNLSKVRRATPDALYNTWAHAYSIEALVKMLDRAGKDEARRKTIAGLIEEQIDRLVRYECIDGGWCYYDFVAHTQRPSGSSISFVTATVLVALRQAKDHGFDVPKPQLDRAMASIYRQQKPDFSYCYGEYLKYVPMMDINRPGGSLGRSQACNLALRRWGDRKVTDGVLIEWLDRLFARNLWLDLSRKRPIPHESWFSVAAYFFYYGHYYAALCAEELDAPRREPYLDHLAQVLLKLQEKDGSWWDFPLYNYHQQYGTAFALMSLERCRQR